MTRLSCNAGNCASNKNKLCCRPSIQVQGQQAEHACDTRCQSFSEKENGSACAPCNSTQRNNGNSHLEVKCNAMNCIHNQGGDCQAENIHINGAAARSFSETECSSFRAKK